MNTHKWFSAKTKDMLPVLALALSTVLSACGAEPTPSPPGSIGAQATATTNTSTTSAPPEGVSNDSRMGIDMANADPCALVTREEAEALMGPLDWTQYSHPLNDPGVAVKCEFDAPFTGVTPDKSLALRLVAPNMWQASYEDLEGEGTSRVPRQDIGFAAEAAVRYDDARRAQLPGLCDLELPCVISAQGTDWLTLTAILPDRSAFQLETNPRETDLAAKLAKTILERLPAK